MILTEQAKKFANDFSRAGRRYVEEGRPFKDPIEFQLELLVDESRLEEVVNLGDEELFRLGKELLPVFQGIHPNNDFENPSAEISKQLRILSDAAKHVKTGTNIHKALLCSI